MYFHALKSEHDKLRIILTIMTGSSIQPEEREQYFNEFKRAYVDHSEVEELFIFTPLQQCNIEIKEQDHSVAHQRHESAIKQLCRLPIHSQLWMEVAQDLKHSLMQHMREEEMTLFPIAQQELPIHKQEQLAKDYTRFTRLQPN